MYLYFVRLVNALLQALYRRHYESRKTPTLGAFLALLLKSSTRHEQTIKKRVQN